MKEIVAAGPAGSVKLPAGDFTLSMKVWIGQESNLETLQVVLDSPELEAGPIELVELKKKWGTVSQTFSRDQPSGDVDRMRIKFTKPESVSDRAVYFDDICIEKSE